MNQAPLSIRVTPDPLKKHKGLTLEDIDQQTRPLVALMVLHHDDAHTQPLAEYFKGRPNYYKELKGYTVTISGALKYPTPGFTCLPLAYLQCGGKTVILYPHNFIAIIENNKAPPAGDNVSVHLFK